MSELKQLSMFEGVLNRSSFEDFEESARVLFTGSKLEEWAVGVAWEAMSMYTDEELIEFMGKYAWRNHGHR